MTTIDCLDVLEGLLSNRDYEGVDELLDGDDCVPSDLDPAGILAVLSITYWGKDKLKNRGKYLARVEPVLVLRLGRERAEHLLENRR